MSLIRQVWLLVLGIIVFALVGSVATSIWTARGYLQTQLALKNGDNAQSLALTLSQQGGDVGLIDLALSAQFDIGHYRSIRLRDEQGRVLAERVAGPVEPDVPRWFSQWVEIESRPGLAQVSSGWAPVGQIEVISQPSFAYADLWRGAWTTAAWMGLVGMVAALVAHFAVRRLRRPLDAAVAQAQALSQRRYLTLVEPRVPELREVSRAMNLMVERIRLQFNEQAAQVDTLRRQANGDALTGLSHRAHFLSCLHAGLSQDDVPVDGQLVLVRMLGLAELNLLEGHQTTDAMLQSAARQLEVPVAGAVPQAAGRLNGSDFAVLYGADGVAADLPDALMARLRAILERHAGASLVMSVVRLRSGDTEATLLARADAGLACAEAHGRFEIEVVDQSDPLAQAGGEASWRLAIREALRQGRVRMGQFSVIDRTGHQLHIECPLRLQVSAGGDFQVAARWLPHAMRTGLTSEVDVCAIDLALRAIALDHQPRCINVSPRSLADAAFLPRIVARLKADPVATRLLWVEVDASVLGQQATALGDLSARLRPLGVRVGIEHAGDRLPTSHAVFESGLDYVKLAQTVSQGVAGDAARLSLLKGVVSMLHGLGLAVYAEGLGNTADIAGCWASGVDAVTGPAV